jgi:hypothetical protein
MAFKVFEGHLEEVSPASIGSGGECPPYLFIGDIYQELIY